MVKNLSGAEGVKELSAQDIRSGNRRALARAITLIESAREDHRASAQALLEQLLPDTGQAVRIGISGSPGVGTSGSSILEPPPPSGLSSAGSGVGEESVTLPHFLTHSL